MGLSVFVRFFAARPHAPIDGILDRNNTSSSRVHSAARRRVPLHFAIWLGNDLCQACVGRDHANLQILHMAGPGCRSWRDNRRHYRGRGYQSCPGCSDRSGRRRSRE